MRTLVVLAFVLVGCPGLSDTELAEYGEQSRAAEACKEFGRCSWNKEIDVEPWQGDLCVPGSVQDCQSSELCARTGMCGLDELCITTEEGCQASEMCRRMGACHKDGSSCRPLSDDDCSRSEACTNVGNCRLAGQECGQ
jgi:hypothetical protein